MTTAKRELKSIADDIRRYARKIRNEPESEEVETWAKRIARLTDDLDTVAKKIERGLLS